MVIYVEGFDAVRMSDGYYVKICKRTKTADGLVLQSPTFDSVPIEWSEPEEKFVKRVGDDEFYKVADLNWSITKQQDYDVY